jgi:ABC-type multidrug transport system ATPase subunit
MREPLAHPLRALHLIIQESSMTLAIELIDIDKSYGKHVVLRQLALDVPERSVFAFLGNNGHGKSTTIRLIAGLSSPDAGSIRIFGRDVRHDRRRILSEVGFLIEAPSSYPNLTGTEFLSIGARLKKLPVMEIERTLELVGLHCDRRQRIEHYSLGMRQRLALAHALLGRPRLLVLDEPTNGLDPDGIQDIRRLLSTLPQMADCTIFFASHYLDEVEKTATHIAVLRDGAIDRQASVQDLRQQLVSALVMEIDDASRGADVLRSFGYAVTYEAPTRLRVPAIDRNRAGHVHTCLVQAGLTLYESTLRKPTLEQWFLQTASRDGDQK